MSVRAVWVCLSARARVRGAGPLIADGFDDGVERRVFPEVQVRRGHLAVRRVAGVMGDLTHNRYSSTLAAAHGAVRN